MNLQFLGLARDCETTLPKFFALLQQLETLDIHCHAIIGENGSRDRTRELIVSEGPHVELVDTSFMADIDSRLERMATARQMLLTKAQRRPAADFVCVIDLDVLTKPLNPYSIKAAIERLERDTGLFAVGAMSRPLYYDLLAMRMPCHDYEDMNAQTILAQRNALTYYGWVKHHIWNERAKITKLIGKDGLRVSSSFNGIVIYVAQAYALGTYRAADEAHVCEHVTLHKSIARRTTQHMMIIPELTIKTPEDHMPTSFWRFWLDRFVKLVARRF